MVSAFVSRILLKPNEITFLFSHFIYIMRIFCIIVNAFFGADGLFEKKVEGEQPGKM